MRRKKQEETRKGKTGKNWIISLLSRHFICWIGRVFKTGRKFACGNRGGLRWGRKRRWERRRGRGRGRGARRRRRRRGRVRRRSTMQRIIMKMRNKTGSRSNGGWWRRKRKCAKSLWQRGWRRRRRIDGFLQQERNHRGIRSRKRKETNDVDEEEELQQKRREKRGDRRKGMDKTKADNQEGKNDPSEERAKDASKKKRDTKSTWNLVLKKAHERWRTMSTTFIWLQISYNRVGRLPAPLYVSKNPSLPLVLLGPLHYAPNKLIPRRPRSTNGQVRLQNVARTPLDQQQGDARHSVGWSKQYICFFFIVWHFVQLRIALLPGT